METSNGNQQERSNDSVWQFLAEYPLSELLSDPEIRDGCAAGLLQSMQEMGIPLAFSEHIVMTLTGFAKEALAHFKQGGLESPGQIRVFCQKKLISEAISTKTSTLYNAEVVTENAQVRYPSGTKMNGGWGYYVIEKGRDLAYVPCKEPGRTVELYIYNEGK